MMKTVVNCITGEVREIYYTEKEITNMSQQKAERDFLEYITPNETSADKAETELIVVELLLELGVL